MKITIVDILEKINIILAIFLIGFGSTTLYFYWESPVIELICILNIIVGSWGVYYTIKSIKNG